MQPCGRCFGSGKITCPSCGGRRQLSRLDLDNQVELFNCVVCNAQGKVRCDFCRGTGRIPSGPLPPPPPQLPPLRLRRSTTDRWLGGVCGGLGAASGIKAWIWRLLFALLLVFGGTGLLLYLLLWIFVPAD